MYRVGLVNTKPLNYAHTRVATRRMSGSTLPCSHALIFVPTGLEPISGVTTSRVRVKVSRYGASSSSLSYGFSSSPTFQQQLIFFFLIHPLSKNIHTSLQDVYMPADYKRSSTWLFVDWTIAIMASTTTSPKNSKRRQKKGSGGNARTKQETARWGK